MADTKQITEGLRPLSSREQQIWAEYQRLRKKAMDSVIDFALVLDEVNKRELWRCEYDCYETFLRVDLGIAKATAYYWLQAASVFKAIGETSSGLSLSQAVVIEKRVKSDSQRKRVVNLARRKSGGTKGGTIATSALKEAINEVVRSDAAKEAGEARAAEADSELLNGVDLILNTRAVEFHRIGETIKRLRERILTLVGDDEINLYLNRDSLRHLVKELDQLMLEIVSAKPYQRCPYCLAKGSSGCDTCHQRGWVTRTMFRQAPQDYQDAAETVSV
jgi:hypothetical protein